MKLFILLVLTQALSIPCEKLPVSGFLKKKPFLSEGKQIFRSWQNEGELQTFVRSLEQYESGAPNFLDNYKCVEDNGQFHLITNVLVPFVGYDGKKDIDLAVTKSIVEGIINIMTKFPGKFPRTLVEKDAVFIDPRTGIAKFNPSIIIDNIRSASCGDSRGNEEPGYLCVLKGLFHQLSSNHQLLAEIKNFIGIVENQSNASKVKDFLTQFKNKIQVSFEYYHEKQKFTRTPGHYANLGEKTLFIKFSELNGEFNIDVLKPEPWSYVVQKDSAPSIITSFVCLSQKDCVNINELENFEVYLTNPPASMIYTIKVKKQLIPHYGIKEEVYYFIIYLINADFFVEKSVKVVNIYSDASTFIGVCKNEGGEFYTLKNPESPPKDRKIEGDEPILLRLVIDNSKFLQMSILADFDENAKSPSDCSSFESDLRVGTLSYGKWYHYFTREKNSHQIKSLSFQFRLDVIDFIPLVNTLPYPYIKIKPATDYVSSSLVAYEDQTKPESKFQVSFNSIKMNSGNGVTYPFYYQGAGTDKFVLFDISANPGHAILKKNNSPSDTKNIQLKLLKFPLTPFSFYDETEISGDGLYYLIEAQKNKLLVTFFVCLLDDPKNFCYKIKTDEKVKADNKNYLIEFKFENVEISKSIQTTTNFHFLDETNQIMIRGENFSRPSVKISETCYKLDDKTKDNDRLVLMLADCANKDAKKKISSLKNFCTEEKREFKSLFCGKRLI